MANYIDISGPYSVETVNEKKVLLLSKETSLKILTDEDYGKRGFKGIAFAFSFIPKNILDKQYLLSDKRYTEAGEFEFISYLNGSNIVLKIQDKQKTLSGIIPNEVNTVEFLVLNNKQVYAIVNNEQTLCFEMDSDIVFKFDNDLLFGKRGSNDGFVGNLINVSIGTFVWNELEGVTEDTPKYIRYRSIFNETHEPYDFFVDFNYANHYIENEPYPDRYKIDEDSEDPTILSTHYKIELDMSVEPFGTDYVINENLARTFYRHFEDLRPVVRVCHYHEYMRFITDFTGKSYNIYSNYYGVVAWNTRCIQATMFKDGSYIVDFTGKDATEIWDLTHSLKSLYLVCQCFDENLNLIEPRDKQAISYDTYRVTFDKPMKGYALLSKPNWTEYMIQQGHVWEASNENDYLDDLILQTVKEDLEVFLPNAVEIKDNGFIEIDTVFQLFGHSHCCLCDYFHYQNAPAEKWIVEHNLGYNAVFVECFDESRKKMYPASIKLIDKKTCEITWPMPVKGTAGIKAIGNISFIDDIIDDLLTDGGGYIKLGDEFDRLWGYGKEWIDPVTNEVDLALADIKHEIYRAKIKRVEETEDLLLIHAEIPNDVGTNLAIREFGVFDKEDRMLFYSQGSLIYKPEEWKFDIVLKISKRDIIRFNLYNAMLEDELR